MSRLVATWEAGFNQIADALLSQLQEKEHFTLTLTGEASQFIRCNQGRVRQTGQVLDGLLTLTLMAHQRSASLQLPFTAHPDTDWPQILAGLDLLRQDLSQLPPDPYLVLPQGEATSHQISLGQLLPPEQAAAALLAPVEHLDFAGLYAGGTSFSAYADGVGQRHWFATDTFTLDYSLFTADGEAVKGIFAGDRWNAEAYQQDLATTRTLLTKLQQPRKAVPKGQYRTYLAPAATADLIGMFSWGGVSEAAIQQGSSALRALAQGEKSLSPLFSLQEDFRPGRVPRFNRQGEVAPMVLPLIEAGQLVNTLVSSRSAKQYGKPSNFAGSGEGLRSPHVLPGSLSAENLLSTLDRGLYLSNLHYLNWSDRPNGRVTGMTRYACFWVESGEIVAPIEPLRFDDSLYRFFGDQLIALSDTAVFLPDVGTYGGRSLGGTWAPGLLVEDFTFTL